MTILLGVEVALMYVAPSPITVGCTVVGVAMWVFTTGNIWLARR
jgi:hypothetical protein